MRLRQQEGICPFCTILKVAVGLGMCSLPGMRAGKQAVSCWDHLVQGACIACPPVHLGPPQLFPHHTEKWDYLSVWAITAPLTDVRSIN